MAEPESSSGERIHGLDAYRAVLMMLGILLHAAMPFDSISPNKFNNPGWSSGIIGYVSAVIHIFRMPAFFVLVGFFMALLWDLRGAKATLKNRFERIILPFLVFVPVIDQLLVEQPGLVVFERRIMLTHHLWFLYYLGWMLPIIAVAASISKRYGVTLQPKDAWWKKTFESLPRFVITFALLSFVPMFIERWPTVPVDPSWTVNPSKLIFYLLFVASGWGMYRANIDFETLKPHAGKTLALGLVLSMVFGGVRFFIAGFSPQVPPPTTMTEEIAWAGMLLAHGLALACVMRGLMGLFLRWVPSRSKGWRYASDAAYWVYLLHLVVCLALPYLWVGTEVPAFFLYVANIVLTTLICFTTYDLFVRSTFIGRFLNGRRYERGPQFWRVSGVCTVVVCLGFSFQFAAAQAEIMQQKQEVEATKWEAWESKGGAPSILPFFDAVHGSIPRIGGEENGPACMPSGRYAVCHHPRDYQEAKLGCESIGAHLVVIESDDEKSHVGTIWSAFGFGDWYWIGLDELAEEGAWLWVDGTPVDYTAWYPKEPNNYGQDEDCVATSSASQHAWHDFPCDAELIFLCEFPPAPTQEASGTFQAAPNPPDGFEGTWYLSSESLAAFSALQAAPLDQQQPTLAFVDALNLKLSFGSDHVLIGLMRLGAYQELKLPYTITDRTVDTLSMAWDNNDSRQMTVRRRGDALELDDGTRTTRLVLQE